MEEKKSGRKLSLNPVWDKTAVLTGVSRSPVKKIVEEEKKAQDEQQQPKQPPSSTLEVKLDGFDQGVVCLFDLILYVPSTIFQLYRDGSSWVEPVLS